jgi:hypothetical protein
VLFFVDRQVAKSCSDLPRHVLGWGAMWPREWGSLYQRFSSLLCDEAFSSETNKAERGQIWRP